MDIAEIINRQHRFTKHTFTLHKHNATNLHYDLRIQKGKTSFSWVIPKAKLPGKKPVLMVFTGMKPNSVLFLHGEIPEGQYGAGQIDIEDTGQCWVRWDDTIIVYFEGEKVKGYYSIVKQNKNEYFFVRMNQETASEKYKVRREGGE